MCVYIYIYDICMCMYVCVYIYIYIYIFACCDLGLDSFSPPPSEAHKSGRTSGGQKFWEPGSQGAAGQARAARQEDTAPGRVLNSVLNSTGYLSKTYSKIIHIFLEIIRMHIIPGHSLDE